MTPLCLDPLPIRVMTRVLELSQLAQAGNAEALTKFAALAAVLDPQQPSAPAEPALAGQPSPVPLGLGVGHDDLPAAELHADHEAGRHADDEGH